MFRKLEILPQTVLTFLTVKNPFLKAYGLLRQPRHLENEPLVEKEIIVYDVFAEPLANKKDCKVPGSVAFGRTWFSRWQQSPSERLANMIKTIRNTLPSSYRPEQWLMRFLSCSLLLSACFGHLTLAAAPEASAATNRTTTAAADAQSQVPPPSSAPKLSQAELEKLLMPIALYPDPLLATVLPASVFPLEIVQAARFLQDTNKVSKIDEQPWDPTVKAVARIPDALKKLNDDLPWTIQLGEAFLAQDKDVMDTIQALRLKAQNAGTLRNSEQQTIVVTNTIVEKTVEQEVVVVTNTVVQIQPSNPQVVYVPSYPPTVYAPPPGYVYSPYAPLVTFTAGVAMGAIIANNCDWNNGGCHWGGNDIDIERNSNINVNRNVNNIQGGNRVNANRSQKWQPDQSRLRSSGSTAAGRTMESRGWAGANNPSTSARANAQGSAANRVQGSAASSRQANPAARPNNASRPALNNSAASRPTPNAATASRPTPNPSAAARPSPSSASVGSGASRPSVSPSSSGSGRSSAFSGGGNSQSFSQRGSASRSGGGGGAARGGGGGRGGGGRR